MYCWSTSGKCLLTNYYLAVPKFLLNIFPYFWPCPRELPPSPPKVVKFYIFPKRCAMF